MLEMVPALLLDSFKVYGALQLMPLPTAAYCTRATGHNAPQAACASWLPLQTSSPAAADLTPAYPTYQGIQVWGVNKVK